MSSSVTKADLVSAVAAQTGLKKTEVERTLVALTDAIRAALTDGRKVTLVGFGTFAVAERRERRGRNPRTHKPVVIPPSRAVRFRPGKAMKDAVNR